jgi:hypothetical protein
VQSLCNMVHKACSAGSFRMGSQIGAAQYEVDNGANTTTF